MSRDTCATPPFLCAHARLNKQRMLAPWRRFRRHDGDKNAIDDDNNELGMAAVHKRDAATTATCVRAPRRRHTPSQCASPNRVREGIGPLDQGAPAHPPFTQPSNVCATSVLVACPRMDTVASSLATSKCYLWFTLLLIIPSHVGTSKHGPDGCLPSHLNLTLPPTPPLDEYYDDAGPPLPALSSRRLCAYEHASQDQTPMTKMLQGTIVLDQRLRPTFAPWSSLDQLGENLTTCERQVSFRGLDETASCESFARCVRNTADPDSQTQDPEACHVRSRKLVGVGGLPRQTASDLRATLGVLSKRNSSLVIAGDSVSHLFCSWAICELIGSGAEIIHCEQTNHPDDSHDGVDESSTRNPCMHGMRCIARWSDGTQVVAPVYLHFTGPPTHHGTKLYNPKTFKYDLGELSRGMERLGSNASLLVFNGGLRFNAHPRYLSDCNDESETRRRLSFPDNKHFTKHTFAKKNTVADTTKASSSNTADGLIGHVSRVVGALHRRTMKDWLMWLDNFGAQVGNIAIWRETTAQAMATTNGYFDYMRHDQGKTTCVLPEQLSDSSVFSFRADWRNRIVYEVLETYNLTHTFVLPLYRNSLRQIYRSTSDCTHSCVTPLMYKPLWLSLYHIAVANDL